MQRIEYRSEYAAGRLRILDPPADGSARLFCGWLDVPHSPPTAGEGAQEDLSPVGALGVSAALLSAPAPPQ